MRLKESKPVTVDIRFNEKRGIEVDENPDKFYF